MSPAYRAGLIHGAYAAARPARYRAGYLGYLGQIGWQYRRGYARGFRAARPLPPMPRAHQALGRCWCRGQHGLEEAIMMNGGNRNVRTAAPLAAPGTGTRTAAQVSPLERARQAAQR